MLNKFLKMVYFFATRIFKVIIFLKPICKPTAGMGIRFYIFELLAESIKISIKYHYSIIKRAGKKFIYSFIHKSKIKINYKKSAYI